MPNAIPASLEPDSVATPIKQSLAVVSRWINGKNLEGVWLSFVNPQSIVVSPNPVPLQTNNPLILVSDPLAVIYAF